MSISFVRDCLACPPEEKVFRHLLLGISAPSREGKRKPLAFALVLDRSSSMGGERLHMAKCAASMLLERLDERDRFCIVAFDQNAKTIAPLLSATPENIARATAALGGISTGWGTDLLLGWRMAARQLLDGLGSHLGQILLLTDGYISTGIDDPDVICQLVEGVGRQGVGTSTIGLGMRYNELLLQDMAASSGGRSFHASASDALPVLFTREMTENLDIVAKDVRLCLHLPEGVTLREIGQKRLLHQSGVVRLVLNHLASNQLLQLALRFRLPAREAGHVHRIPIWLEDADGLFSSAASELLWEVRQPEEPDEEASPEVMRFVGERMGLVGRFMALQSHRRKDYASAMELLEKTAREIEAFAGGDAELWKLVAKLREEVPVYGRRMKEARRRSEFGEVSSMVRGLSSEGISIRIPRSGRGNRGDENL
jgi:Ca-activated chloride channel homolog